MKTLLSLVFAFLLVVGIAAILAPHRAVAQASEYATLFAQCRASGGDPGTAVDQWNQTGCKCGGVATGRATCPQDSSSSAETGGGSSDLATQSATAMVKGVMNGNSQEFGLGVGGMILNGMLEGSQEDDAAAEAERARQAEIARQNAIRAQQEYARKMAAAKGRILSVLKDSTDGGDPFRPDTGTEGAVATIHEGPLTVGGLTLKSDDAVQQASLPKPDNDPMVVDARNVPSGLPKGMDDAIAIACAGTPEGVCERVRKGFQAVMTRDWNVAKAWFQDAANRDPKNPWLNNLVAHTSATTSKPPAASGAPVSDADLDKVFDQMANDNRIQQAKDAALDRAFDQMANDNRIQQAKDAELDKEFDQMANEAQMQRMRQNDALNKAFDLYYNAPPPGSAPMAGSHN